jgi:hypothetical protein
VHQAQPICRHTLRHTRPGQAFWHRRFTLDAHFARTHTHFDEHIFVTQARLLECLAWLAVLEVQRH